MPYANVSELPARIKRLPAKKKRQWMHVWNNVYSRTKDESRAFAAANSVVSTRAKEAEMAKRVALDELLQDKSAKVTMYTGCDDPDLPDYVKALPMAVRARWVSNYNWALQECMDDGDAQERADEYTSVSVADMSEMDMSSMSMKEDDSEDDDPEIEAAPGELIEQQEKAVLRAAARNKLKKSSFAYVDSEGKGHLPIHDAAHVRNALARMNQTNMPSSAKAGARRKIMAAAKRFGVEVSGANKSMGGMGWFDRFKAWLSNDDTSMLPVQPAEAGTDAGADASVAPTFSMFNIYKGSDDSLRVLTVYSNNFKDKQHETISADAHQEYAEAAERGDALYPDLHLWHGGPATKWGTVETVSVVDGFAVAGGVVDPGKEHVALALKELADKGEIAVSFGFYGLRGPDGVYHLYRPFEISPLPVGSEANPWTSVDVATKESGMAFSARKKEWLKTHFKMSDGDVAAAETKFADMATKLKAAGIDFKDDDGEVAPPPAPVVTAPPPPAPVAASDGAMFQQLATMGEAIGGLAAVVKSLQDDLATYKKQDGATVEQRAQEQVLARIVGAGAGHSPASSPATVVAGAKEAEDDWLDQAMRGVWNMPVVDAGAAIAHVNGEGAK